MKAIICSYIYCRERIYRNQPKEEMHRVGSKRAPNLKLPLFSGCVILPALTCDNMQRVLTPREAHLSFCVQKCIEASLHRLDWLITWLPTWMNSVSRSTDTRWPKATTINHKVSLSGVANPHPKTIRCGQMKEEEKEVEEDGWEERIEERRGQNRKLFFEKWLIS